MVGRDASEGGDVSDEKRLRKREVMAGVRCVQAILRRWDPIGVAPGEFGPADEYDGYAPHIVSMVSAGCSLEELVRHLGEIRTRTIGVEANAGHDRTIAEEILRDLREASG